MKKIRRTVKKLFIKCSIILKHNLKMRLISATLFTVLMFFFISSRIIYVTNGNTSLNNSIGIANVHGYKPKRQNIYDRNGNLLATNIPVSSAFIDPSKIKKPEDFSGKLLKIFPNLNQENLEKALLSNRKFFWIKRHLTPNETQQIIDLGEPGIYFKNEEMRSYPYKSLFSHLVGTVDVDNNGTSGIEKYFNSKLNNNEDIRLSIDVKLQSIIKDEVQNSINLHDALGGCGIMADIETGEVLAMVSLPDFEPQSKKVIEEQRFNRATMGLYEPGSTMKPITVATALNENSVKLNDIFDISKPIKIGRHRISDYRPKHKELSLPEVITQSSNIGMAQIVEKMGSENQQQYLQNLGFFDKISSLQISELSTPSKPNASQWGRTSSITISYGHGIAVTPMHMVQGYIPLVNGGYGKDLTLLLNDNENKEISSLDNNNTIFSDQTSEIAKKLLHLVVKSGFGKNANVSGYDIGGKTGTSEKIKNGRYSNNNIASFVGAFPIDQPKYILYVMIDEPKRNKHNRGFATGGMVAAPTAGNIIKRVMPVVNILPKNNYELEEQLYAFYEPYKTIR